MLDEMTLNDTTNSIFFEFMEFNELPDLSIFDKVDFKYLYHNMEVRIKEDDVNLYGPEKNNLFKLKHCFLRRFREIGCEFAQSTEKKKLIEYSLRGFIKDYLIYILKKPTSFDDIIETINKYSFYLKTFNVNDEDDFYNLGYGSINDKGLKITLFNRLNTKDIIITKDECQNYLFSQTTSPIIKKIQDTINSLPESITLYQVGDIVERTYGNKTSVYEILECSEDEEVFLLKCLDFEPSYSIKVKYKSFFPYFKHRISEEEINVECLPKILTAKVNVSELTDDEVFQGLRDSYKIWDKNSYSYEFKDQVVRPVIDLYGKEIRVREMRKCLELSDDEVIDEYVEKISKRVFERNIKLKQKDLTSFLKNELNNSGGTFCYGRYAIGGTNHRGKGASIILRDEREFELTYSELAKKVQEFFLKQGSKSYSKKYSSPKLLLDYLFNEHKKESLSINEERQDVEFILGNDSQFTFLELIS